MQFLIISVVDDSGNGAGLSSQFGFFSKGAIPSLDQSNTAIHLVRVVRFLAPSAMNKNDVGKHRFLILGRRRESIIVSINSTPL